MKLLENFHPQIEKETVFRLLHCYPDSPVYEDMEEAYDEILGEMTALCRPEGVMALGSIPGQYTEDHKDREAVHVLVTVGSKMSEYSTRAFAEGEYVKGMLADAMADAALFSLEADIQRELRDACVLWKKGVQRRLEAPHDIPMEIQLEVLKQTDAKTLLGIEISEGYMFRPVKTACHIYQLTDDSSVFKAQHNCRKCDNYTCMMRKVKPLTIRVVRDDMPKDIEFTMMEGTLLEALNKQINGIPSPCGGRGACGKCRVRVLEGTLPVKDQDRKTFSEKELEEGWRLACQAVPDEDLTIRTGWSSETDIDVLTSFQGEKTGHSTIHAGEENYFGFAVDIGTTTLVVQLISLKTGKCLDTYTGLNTQRTYGADVIGRIQASIDGKGDTLKKLIREALWTGVEQLCRNCTVEWNQIKRIVISGNTTMVHLLMGYPCSGLGSVPFTPYEIGTIWISGKELFRKLPSEAEVIIYPGITAFVGPDIVSGLCALHMGTEEPVSLLIDLGTNGEMALGNRDKLLVTSTAAGPAFEGGNITWGTGSIPGAVCNAWTEDGKIKVQTIQNRSPVGICGTGVIELVAELVSAGIVDETGRLGEPWFEEGYPVAVSPQGETICLLQKDIREFQLAKAAVRAGIETLLEMYSIKAEEVDRVYVAGGFGCQLDYEKAIRIGIFPEVLKGKIHAVGNSSLWGAAELLLSSEYLTEAEKVAAAAREIELASNPVFQKAYMDAMYFE